MKSDIYTHQRVIPRQEGESYKRITVTVTTKTGLQIPCFVYVMRDNKGKSLPSKPYLDTLIEGAREHGLPNEYIANLEKMDHNGYCGTVSPP